MKKHSLFIFLFAVYGFVNAQNLVPNSSFEVSDTCPNAATQISYASQWFRATQGTPDYFNACFDSSVSWTNVV